MHETCPGSRLNGCCAQASTTQLQSDMQEKLRRQSAQDSVLKESMQQLAVARQLLQEFSGGQERDRLRAAEAEAQKLQQMLVAKSREVELLQQRLSSTEQQLQYTERQLGVLVAASPNTLSPAGSGQGPSAAGQQLRRVLEVKEERIRCGSRRRVRWLGAWHAGTAIGRAGDAGWVMLV